MGTSWSRRTIELPAEGPRPHRLELSTPGFDSPRSVGLNEDPRCLSIKVRGVELGRRELFDLVTDREARSDLSRQDPRSLARLVAELEALTWEAVAPPRQEGLAEEEAEALRALGYIQ